MSMDGPSCLVWVPEGSVVDAAQAAEDAARAVAGPNATSFLFSLTDSRPIGGRLRTSKIPMHIRPERVFEDADEMQVEVMFGFKPDPVPFRVGTSLNDRDAHRAVAELAAYLAETVGGVVDLRGPIPVHGLSGRWFEIGEGAAGGIHRRTFVDAMAMRAWSNRDDCWMMV